VKGRLTEIVAVVTLVCSAASLISSTSTAAAKSPTKSTLTIGAISTLTGFSPTPREIGYTLTAWQKWVNSHGGVGGHPVKVVSLDDADDPGRSLADAQQLINQHVLAIIDNTSLDTTWASNVAAAGVPVICGTEDANGFVCQSNPDFFPAGGTVLAELFGDFQAAKVAGAKKVGVVYCTESTACQEALPVIKGATDKLGLQSAPPEAASSTAVNYTSQCLAFQQEKVDAVFPAGPPSSQLADNCAQQGFKPIYVEASGTWRNDFLGNANLNRATGTVADLPWSVTNTPAARTFHAAIGTEVSAAESPYNLITVWAAGLLFEAAAAHAGDNPTTADIINGLYSLHDDTLGGFSPPLTFVRGQSHVVPYYYFLAIKDGKFTAPDGAKPTKEPGGVSS
jgi:branched-chain amino acid transport system substrate-binding protein